MISFQRCHVWINCITWTCDIVVHPEPLLFEFDSWHDPVKSAYALIQPSECNKTEQIISIRVSSTNILKLRTKECISHDWSIYFLNDIVLYKLIQRLDKTNLIIYSKKQMFFCYLQLNSRLFEIAKEFRNC